MNKHGTNMTEKVPVDIGTRSEVQAFENRRIPHDSYSIAFNRAWSLATRGHSSRVVIVTGPTGVGKSTLGTSLLKYVQRAHEADLAANSSLIPAVLVKTIAHHGRSFSWKDFYVRSLEQLRDPLVERKVWSPMQMTLLGPEIRGRTGADTIDIDVLRRSLESATAHRKTRIMIVDEAHHMLCGDPRKLGDQFETIKSLADTCNATLILLGTYKLLMIRDYSAQLSRRTQIVHFPPYRIDNARDLTAFKSVLTQFAEWLPIPLAADLREDYMYFFLKTAGCVGILHDLLRDALCEAIQDTSRKIARTMVDRVAQTNKAIETILEEEALGAVELEDTPLNEVRAMVGKQPREIVAERMRRIYGIPADAPIAVPGGAEAAGPKATGKRALPPGQRLPIRDRVAGPTRGSIL
ncbi:MAG: AAA family ATPase [Rhodocyclaceae bacterium]|nr:AAA family ATPase [Rhodocyclaceae bacterium]